MSENELPAQSAQLANYLLRLADDRLILGHRLSEWCASAPILEEDIALANIALDLIGQAEALLQQVVKLLPEMISADNLAFLRDTVDFRCCLLVQQPNGDFAATIARQFLFDCYSLPLLKRLKLSSFQPLADIATKAFQETSYHFRHTREWVLRLGDGTEESHNRMQRAFDELWKFCPELFEKDSLQTELESSEVAPELAAIEVEWREEVEKFLKEATISIPDTDTALFGGRSGRHTEHLGHLLSEMQILRRSHPEAHW